MILHVGGASTATALVTVIAIFFLLFAMSFAVGDVPAGGRRFSSEWFRAWSRASLPRFIVAASFSALLFIGSSLSGGGDSSDAQSCDAPLAPLTGERATDLRLGGAITGMREIAAAAREGDSEAAQRLFFTTDAHNLTHDVAGPLFSAERGLARDLCESVIGLENEIAGDLRPAVLAEHADAIALTLNEARGVLDLAGTATPVPGAAGPCALPIGAVTQQPLTEERLSAAVAMMRDTAEFARAGNVGAASEAFAGDAHNITHDIDGPLRDADAELAVALCESVLEVELQFAGAADADVIAAEAETSAGLLEDAGRALGITQ